MNIVFNENTLNIFTDASITKLGGETISCAGCIVEHNGNIIHTNTRVLRHSTNNEGELTAIYLGVLAAIQFRTPNITTINLFSDSLLSVSALREWIYSWVRNINNQRLYTNSGDEVKNQDIIMSIIFNIVSNCLNINLYHVKGHVNPNNMNINNKHSILYAKKKFYQINGMNIDLNLMRILCGYNNIVDELTRVPLREVFEPQDKLVMPFMYDPNGLDMKSYKNIMRRG